MVASCVRFRLGGQPAGAGARDLQGSVGVWKLDRLGLSLSHLIQIILTPAVRGSDGTSRRWPD
jgi:hypothetical protein